MTIDQKINLCSKVLATWTLKENRKESTTISGFREDSFIAKILDKKFNVFGIDVVLPDPLIIILELCTEANPGQSQVILKDLLSNTNIKHGYTVTAADFASVFKDSFPITAISEIDAIYHKLWEEQKSPYPKGPENLVDTVGYWEEIFK